jgi:cell division protein FtsW
VLGLFIVLAVSFIKIVRRSDTAFVRIVTGAIMTWIIGQALVNIAVVLGLLPVLGVPLPLISAGGSSLIFVLAALGVVLSFLHHAPDDEASEIATRERVGSLR